MLEQLSVCWKCAPAILLLHGSSSGSGRGQRGRVHRSNHRHCSQSSAALAETTQAEPTQHKENTDMRELLDSPCSSLDAEDAAEVRAIPAGTDSPAIIQTGRTGEKSPCSAHLTTQSIA